MRVLAVPPQVGLERREDLGSVRSVACCFGVGHRSIHGVGLGEEAVGEKSLGVGVEVGHRRFGDGVEPWRLVACCYVGRGCVVVGMANCGQILGVGVPNCTSGCYEKGMVELIWGMVAMSSLARPDIGNPEEGHEELVACAVGGIAYMTVVASVFE